MADLIVEGLKALAADQGSTVIMVSHDMELIEKFADPVFMLRPEIIANNHIRSEIQMENF